MIADKNGVGAEASAAGIGHGARGMACDVFKEADVAALFDTVADGKAVDILINAAGIVPFIAGMMSTLPIGKRSSAPT